MEPVPYGDFLLFHRVQSSNKSGNGWDLVIHNTCVRVMVTQRALINWVDNDQWVPAKASPLLLATRVGCERPVKWPWERWQHWTEDEVAEFAKQANVGFRAVFGGELTFYEE